MKFDKERKKYIIDINERFYRLGVDDSSNEAYEDIQLPDDSKRLLNSLMKNSAMTG